ncbi:hypothetical protein SLEP1_g58517 [Rubroshorea leprosula]|uniref:non-specific serine/threonine protein kinase n=1 Tax=Rubroshorea leprosula TaxID=152421 RepID=A0AAV5MRZ9_9ROSI|nr:hypothetical protein SLEP1_g58517 [Rubroshorea leprosula]
MKKTSFLLQFSTVLSLLLLSFQSYPVTALSSTNETDKLALLAIKGRITQDIHGIMNSWNESLHFCGWMGVTCSRRHKGRVTLLSLEKHGLIGSIPPQIGNLSFLRGINLAQNFLHGQIPQELGRLSRLRFLNLSNNVLQGEILGNLSFFSNLEVLNVSYNMLVGKIPNSLETLGMKRLNTLLLGSNKLTGTIPKWLGRASSLVQLSLTSNRLHGSILGELGKLLNLSILRVSANNLFGVVPLAIYNLSSLIILSLAVNQLHGQIPNDIGLTLPNLQVFFCRTNYFIGWLPVSLSNASQLKKIGFESNNFSGLVPPNLGRLSALEVLALGENQLENIEGDDFNFLASLTNCSKLFALDLGVNRFKGHWPTSIVNLSSKLKYLSIEDNQISGRVPDGIGNLIGLAGLALQQNFLTGEIPNSIGRLEKLNELWSSDNQFSELSQATNNFSSANLIGEGSFGSVYKGIMGEHGMLVAVKVLNLKQKGASKSFVAECEAMRNIHHQNLIKVLTVCSSIDFKGVDFKAIVYEFMQNGNLDEWLHSTEVQVGVRNFNFIKRLNVVIEVAHAIEYLHYHCQPAIVHGDLKPSNILLDHEMVAHVGDFGLTRFLISSKKTSSLGTIRTIGYVAPEYGTGGKASMAGDVFSFGILLLEMITGKRPTDAIFKDGLNLHQFAKLALSERVMDIVDPSLLQELRSTDENIGDARRNKRERRVSIKEILITFARIGVLYSMDSSNDRMEMKDVVVELCIIRDKFLGNRS